MRPIVREQLNSRPLSWLARNQAALDSDPSIDPSRRWAARRPTMNNNGIVAALRGMAGARQRCMYCGDSEGCDIEHYFPKANPLWRDRVFSWGNMLWICAPCNRLKNATFTLNEGRPLLLNPESDYVWDFFDYVMESGQLVPRCDLNPRDRLRAEYTIEEAVSRLSYDLVCESRQITSRNLMRATSRFLESVRDDRARGDFIAHVVDCDHPELCEWHLCLLGSHEEPFASLLEEVPDLVPEVRAELNRRYPGVWLR